MQKAMPKAPNVIKTLLIVTFLMFMVSCKVTKRPDVVDDTYTFEKYTSKSGFSSINVKAYDYEYKNDLSPSVTINSIYYDINLDKKKKTLSVRVSPNNKFDVEVFLLSRHTVKVKEFYIKRGDSIVINAYLKEDNRPVY